MKFHRFLIMVRDGKSWEVLLLIWSGSCSYMTLKSFGLQTRLSYCQALRIWFPTARDIWSLDAWQSLLLVARTTLSWNSSFCCCCLLIVVILGVALCTLVQPILLKPDKPGYEYQIWNSWSGYLALLLLSYSFFICHVNVPALFLWSC